ncbi:YbaK/EbsC family protein [Oceanidesulfovibrio marinus]|uniref:YbaK/EbsC family protein n=1 Tax=Oceanidesulfovibrio marinus TaxID=370038 RepID=A0A6P1ZFT1_9BACT|nr:YbaK/EbsC family protein [Oceanidesulfovibrio marinus]TVM32765.1 YbaK/EbsC family protein [Oceanidesulfovibrio marinus]
MAEELSRSAQKVQEYLSQFDSSLEVMELAGSTRTAQDAADSVGCSVAQIAKSLVFQDKNSDELVLVIASGINRVDTKKIAKTTGSNLKQAKADLVKEKTGFAIGGIPPVGHAEPLKTVLDEDLQHYETIWAAAGTPFAVVKLTPELLWSLTGGTWLDVRQER